MIRGCLGRATLVALLLAVVAASSFENIEITKAQRTVTLSGAYAGENIKVSFVANDDDITHFTYLVPLQYDEAISKIWFSKSEKDKRPLAYAKSIFSYVSCN